MDDNVHPDRSGKGALVLVRGSAHPAPAEGQVNTFGTLTCHVLLHGQPTPPLDWLTHEMPCVVSGVTRMFEYVIVILRVFCRVGKGGKDVIVSTLGVIRGDIMGRAITTRWNSLLRVNDSDRIENKCETMHTNNKCECECVV